MENATKRCTKCGESKPVTGFAKCASLPDGKQKWCKSCASAGQADWYKRNRESYLKKCADRKARNPEHVNRISRESNARSYKRDPARHIGYTLAWNKRNPERLSKARVAASMRRRAVEKKAPGNPKARDLRYLMDSYLGKCAYCMSAATQFDHVIPLASGGTNYVDNLVPACERCNKKKTSHSLLKFMLRKAA